LDTSPGLLIFWNIRSVTWNSWKSLNTISPKEIKNQPQNNSRAKIFVSLSEVPSSEYSLLEHFSYDNTSPLSMNILRRITLGIFFWIFILGHKETNKSSKNTIYLLYVGLEIFRREYSNPGIGSILRYF
jgi:hypothetical protein